MRRGLVLSVVGTLALALSALGAVVAAGYSPQLGLDLEGGLSVVYQPAHNVSTQQLDQAVGIIRNRVDALGVAQPNIQTATNRQSQQIIVQLPGIKNPQHALSIIGQTAQLRFRGVLCLADNYVPVKGHPVTPGFPPPCPAQYQQSAKTFDPSTQTQVVPPYPGFTSVPSTPRQLDVATTNVLLPAKGNPGRYLLGPATLTGSAIKSANAAITNTGDWVVNFTLTKAGSPRWDQLAAINFHKQVAIVLDGVVESAPLIQPANGSFQSFAGQGQITGAFTQQQAQDLGLVLQYGALPVQLNRLTYQTVSPTLGKASLKAGLYAGLGGLILVLLYMVLYYRALGIVVLVGLGATAAMLWVIFSILGHTNGLTLDLSGVTGIIVSVGVTVDSYVVYFERLKDEVRAGHSIRQSVDRSFARAYRTILAADLVSLIGAAVLYWLSIGPVKGFALTLGIATLLDVFTAYLFTRPLVILLGRSRWFTEARWIGVASGLAARPVVGRRVAAPQPVGAGTRS